MLQRREGGRGSPPKTSGASSPVPAPDEPPIPVDHPLPASTSSVPVDPIIETALPIEARLAEEIGTGFGFAHCGSPGFDGMDSKLYSTAGQDGGDGEIKIAKFSGLFKTAVTKFLCLARGWMVKTPDKRTILVITRHTMKYIPGVIQSKLNLIGCKFRNCFRCMPLFELGYYPSCNWGFHSRCSFLDLLERRPISAGTSSSARGIKFMAFPVMKEHYVEKLTPLDPRLLPGEMKRGWLHMEAIGVRMQASRHHGRGGAAIPAAP